MLITTFLVLFLISSTLRANPIETSLKWDYCTKPRRVGIEIDELEIELFPFLASHSSEIIIVEFR